MKMKQKVTSNPDQKFFAKYKEELERLMQTNYKNDGYLTPVAIVVDGKGEATFISTPYTCKEEKEAYLFFLKLYCKKHNAVAVYLINEATQAVATKENLKQYKTNGISGCTDTQDVAILVMETREENSITVFEADAKQRNLTNKKVTEKFDGNFARILT